MNRQHLRIISRTAAIALAGVLILTAIAYAVAGYDWSVLRDAPLQWVATLAVCVAANLLLTAMLFWVITRSFDAQPPVGLMRITALICLSGLLNYLPFIRPGLLGRAAYLKYRHGLPLRQSMLILLVVLGLATVVLLAAGAVVLILPTDVSRLAAGAAVMLALSGLAKPIAQRLLRRDVVYAWAWVPLRTADMLVAAGRLWLAFGIVGKPISFADAVLIGAASLLVKLVGLTPNGLGLSEWVVAALAGAISPATTAAGAAAALVDRGAELIVVMVAGLVSAWPLRDMRAAKAQSAGEPPAAVR